MIRDQVLGQEEENQKKLVNEPIVHLINTGITAAEMKMVLREVDQNILLPLMMVKVGCSVTLW